MTNTNTRQKESFRDLAARLLAGQMSSDLVWIGPVGTAVIGFVCLAFADGFHRNQIADGVFAAWAVAALIHLVDVVSLIRNYQFKIYSDDDEATVLDKTEAMNFLKKRRNLCIAGLVISVCAGFYAQIQ